MAQGWHMLSRDETVKTTSGHIQSLAPGTYNVQPESTGHMIAIIGIMQISVVVGEVERLIASGALTKVGQ